MENNLKEIIVPKLKRIRIPGRKRGPGKKPFEEKICLQPEYSLNYNHAKKELLKLFVQIVVGKLQE